MEEKRLFQDAIGSNLVSTARLSWPLGADGTFETRVFKVHGSDWKDNQDYRPIISLTEKEAIRNHKRKLGEVRKSMKYARRENRQEKRIYP